MNTHKRQQAMRSRERHVPLALALAPTPAPAPFGTAAASALAAQGVVTAPVCVPGPGQRCEHALVDQSLNALLHDYDQQMRGRFESIEDVLRTLSGFQHERDFSARAQALSRQRLGFELPADWLDNAWSGGLCMASLHAHAMFKTVERCVQSTAGDRAPWLQRLPVQASTLAYLGLHTVDITPCADGRLQGLVPFILRTAPCDSVSVKSYAGALFDIETDVADWTHRELLRLAGAWGDIGQGYLKVAVYHFSSSAPGHQGCAAHGSQDGVAVKAAIDRLHGLCAAIDYTYGQGAAPHVVLIGVDTDLDALRVHLSDAAGQLQAQRFIDGASLYQTTLGLGAKDARRSVADAVASHLHDLGHAPQAPAMRGLAQLAAIWLEANFSQMEYVVAHHQGRYAVIGHDEQFVCAGDTLPQLQLRNQFYYAHLDTVEEGSADLDVALQIFNGLNIRRGLGMPILVHFTYVEQVPGSQQRALERGVRVAHAIEQRFAALQQSRQLFCRVAVSDRESGRWELLGSDAGSGAGNAPAAH